jgi:hypothetical protein
MVVVVAADFSLPEKSSKPTPPPPPNGAQDFAEFDRLIAPVGRIREPARSRCRRAYMESPEGFAYIVSEALAGDKPAGLLVWLVRQGEHRHGPPLPRGGNLSAADMIREARRLAFMEKVCASCGTGGGRHVDGCEAAAA